MNQYLKNNSVLVFFFLSFSCLGDTLFDNFEKKNINDWIFISDKVMGGISSGKLDFLEENGDFFMRMTGAVSLENNGGFIQARKFINNLNQKNFKSVKILTRGNEMDYFIHLRTKFTLLPWQYYKEKINTGSDWSEDNIYIKDFKPSGFLLPKKINSKNITSIAIVAFGKESEVMIDVKEIKFY